MDNNTRGNQDSPLWLQKVHVEAHGGDAESQFLLGVYFGVEETAYQDLQQSVDWYRQAAAQDHVLAQFNLSVIYSRGQGVDRDDQQAIHWMGKAAQQGDPGAQFHLGTLCHRASLNRASTTAVQDRIESFKWFQLAALQDFPDSVEFRDRITQDMSWAEVAEANQRAQQFAVCS